MVLEPFYLGCLAHASYLVGSGTEAVVIDPQRDVNLYLDAACERGMQIVAVIETHLHADFVSGHRELASRAGARIFLGRDSGALFPHSPVGDGDCLDVGTLRLDFLSTPGHTPESICVVVTDTAQSSSPLAVFTGDTLFVGEVGRPDLCESLTARELAGMLYDSLFHKLLKLPDETLVYPAHGAGSMCGRNISPERFSTIGLQRRGNYALQARSREAFVDMVTAELPPRPGYFARDVSLNRAGAVPLDELPPVPRLSAARVEELRSAGAVLLDTRAPSEFGVSHVPHSWNIALSGQFASWAGTIIGLDSEVVLVAADDERVTESRMRLARVGIERVAGSLENGVDGWRAAGRQLSTLTQIEVAELRAMLSRGQVTVLDVRRTTEWRVAQIEGAVHLPLELLRNKVANLDPNRHYAVHCKSGYRSSIACSLLLDAGFRNVTNVVGGFEAWLAAGLPVLRQQQPAATSA